MVLLLELAVVPVRRLAVLLFTNYKALFRLAQPMAVEWSFRHGGSQKQAIAPQTRTLPKWSLFCSICQRQRTKLPSGLFQVSHQIVQGSNDQVAWNDLPNAPLLSTTPSQRAKAAPDQLDWRAFFTARPASVAVTAASASRPASPTIWF